MNQVSQVITTLIHFNVAVRDTLQYCLKKESYDTKVFEDQKRSILVEVDQHTPLKDIIDHSGENGEKLEKAIRDFHAEIYGDDSTVLKLADDGLRVDHNQHLAIYKNVMPIHENVNNMILGVLNDAHQHQADVEQVEKLWKAEEEMYRGVAYLTLVNDLNQLFNEYNQARNEAPNHEETPAAKFIGNDIGQIIQNINFVRHNAKETDAVYKNMEDKIVALMEAMTGRRDLPAGKRFPDVMREVIETINLYVRDKEAAFRAIYGPTVQELIAQARADEEKRKAEAEKTSEEKKA